MEKEKRLELKQRVDFIGRLAVAESVGMAYTTLGSKLNGFVAFIDGEVDRIELALSKIESEVAGNK